MKDSITVRLGEREFVLKLDKEYGLRCYRANLNEPDEYGAQWWLSIDSYATGYSAALTLHDEFEALSSIEIDSMCIDPQHSVDALWSRLKSIPGIVGQ